MIRWLVAAVLLVAAEAHADSWAEPVTKTIASKSGAFSVTVTPGPIGTKLRTTARLKLQKGKATVYERAAVNHVAPVSVLVSEQGHVVTLGEWHNVGYDHALVIYAPSGDVVIDRRLEELLTLEDRRRIEHSVSSRWWIERGAEVRLAGGDVVVPAIWGDELRWRLADGVQLRGGKPFAIPTDEERFTGYVTGARSWTGASISFGESDDDQGGITCRLTPAESTCEPFGKTSRRTHTTKVAPNAFATALRPAAAFATLVNTQWRGGLDEPHWFITFAFEEAGDGYGYKVLVAKRQTPKDYAVAIAALRKLAGL